VRGFSINNGLTVIGIDVYAQQVFLGVLIIIAVAVTFDRKKVAIIKEARPRDGRQGASLSRPSQ
jgi:ribose/xylose/arabinose/galactoside ABC-type transport system permease subunit